MATMQKWQMEHFEDKVKRQFNPLIEDQELLIRQYKTDATNAELSMNTNYMYYRQSGDDLEKTILDPIEDTYLPYNDNKYKDDPGFVSTNNINELNILEYNKDMTSKKPKYLNFFLERYKESFKIELDDFVKSVINKKKSNVGFEDCRKALIICDALSKSIKLNKSIKVNFD